MFHFGVNSVCCWMWVSYANHKHYCKFLFVAFLLLVFSLLCRMNGQKFPHLCYCTVYVYSMYNCVVLKMSTNRLIYIIGPFSEIGRGWIIDKIVMRSIYWSSKFSINAFIEQRENISVKRTVYFCEFDLL